MTEESLRDDVLLAAPPAPLTLRRALFFVLVGLTIAGQIALAALALSPGGFSAVDIVLIGLFAFSLPWYVIGFCIAMIGLLFMRLGRDPVARGNQAVELFTGA